MRATFIAISFIFLNALTSDVFALPPLTSLDWPLPRYLEREPEGHRAYGVNLFTKSLDGYTASVGIGEFEYDESFSLGNNNAGNFNLSGINFVNGVKVSVPTLEYLFTDEYIVKIGVRKYRLTFFSISEIPGGSRKAYALPKGAKFLLVVDTLSQGGVTYSLHDTATGTIYTFPSASFGPVGSASLPNGFEATFAWEDNKLVNVRLARGALPVEILTITYVNINIYYITSNLDAARNLRLTYSDGNLGTIHIGLLAGETTGIDGYKFTYTDTGSGTTFKKILTGVTNLANKELLKFQVGPVLNGTRTGYTGVRVGPPMLDSTTVPVAFTTFSYLSNNDVLVTLPESPGNPVTLTLHPTRGLATKKKVASCGNPIEELILIADGEPHAGEIYQEKIRPTCDKEQVRTYSYEENDTLKEVRVNADGQTAVTQITQQMSQPKNGSRLMDVTSITAPDQSVVTFNRDTEGLLRSLSSDSGAVTSGYDYEFYDTEQKNIKKIKIYQPNGREDHVIFDNLGRLSEAKTAVASPLEVTSEITYESNGRPKFITDPKGNLTTITYKSVKDSRIESTTTASLDGSETRKTVYGYSTTFPDATTSVRNELTNGGSTIVGTTSYTYQTSTPLLSKIIVSSPIESATLTRMDYDPGTMRPKTICGYSKNHSPQSCSTIKYKDNTAGTLSGKLDKVEVLGGITSGAYEIRPIYNTYGEVEGSTLQDQSHSLTEKVTYDGFGRTKKITNNPDEPTLKSETEFTYDIAGKLTVLTNKIEGALVSDKRVTYADSNKSSRVSSIQDVVSGVTESFQYNDPSKRLTQVKTLGPGNITMSKLQINPGDYDLHDRANRATTLIDGVGQFTTEVSFNRYGETEWTTDPRGNLTTYEYDDFGGLKSWQSPLKKGSITFDLDPNTHTTTVHKTVENITTNPSLKFPITTDTKISSLGTLLSTENQQSDVINLYNYNNKGELQTLIRTFQGSSPVQELSEFTYDVLGRTTEVKHDGEVVSQMQASALGLNVTTKDSRLNPTQVTLDKLGRWKETLYPDNQKDEVTGRFYVPSGSNGPLLVLNTKSRSGDYFSTKYNKLGQVTELLGESAELGELQEVYEYDGSRPWRKTSLFGSTSTQISYDEFDELGRPVLETTLHETPNTEFIYTLGKEFDPQGALIAHAYPPPLGQMVGPTVEYVRDNFGRIVDIKGDGQNIAHYTYDGAVLTSSSILDLTTNYSYAGPKALGLLYGVTDSYDIRNTTYNYDEKYRLKEKKDLGARALTESFTYTNHDMLTSSQLTKTGPGAYTFSESYGARPDGILSGIQTPNPDSMFKLPSFNYDARLNPNSCVDGSTYNFNYYGMEVLQSQTAGTAAFSQDAFGRNIWMGVEDQSGFKKNIFVRDEGMILFHGFKQN